MMRPWWWWVCKLGWPHHLKINFSRDAWGTPRATLDCERCGSRLDEARITRGMMGGSI